MYVRMGMEGVRKFKECFDPHPVLFTVTGGPWNFNADEVRLSVAKAVNCSEFSSYDGSYRNGKHSNVFS